MHVPLLLLAAAMVGSITFAMKAKKVREQKEKEDGPKLDLAKKTPPQKPKTSPPQKPKTKVSGDGKLLPSAIRSVSDKEWTKFVNAMGTGETSGVDEFFRFGKWHQSPRRLVDLGLMRNLRRGTWPPGKGKTVWFADWVYPMDLARFLRSLRAQYRVFSKDMVEHVKYLQKHHAKDIGVLIDGHKVSMSGLLAVAKLAGDKGVNKWLDSEGDRRKFKETTALFERVNGIF